MGKEVGVNGWMIVAIIFIVLFILETIFLIWFVGTGFKALDKETECQVNVCTKNGYDAFDLDLGTNICYCYKNGEVVYQEYLK